jgi:hypothetical protein
MTRNSSNHNQTRSRHTDQTLSPALHRAQHPEAYLQLDIWQINRCACGSSIHAGYNEQVKSTMCTLCRAAFVESVSVSGG